MYGNNAFALLDDENEDPQAVATRASAAKQQAEAAAIKAAGARPAPISFTGSTALY
jgi:hypothetical protein